MFTVEKTITVVCATLALICFVFFAGVRYEHNKNEAKQNKAVIQRIAKVEVKQVETSKEISKSGIDYEKEYALLKTEHSRVLSDYSRLRVKRANCPMSTATAAGTTSARDAASTGTGSENGLGTGEINLDGIAGQIIELGLDYDNANLRIEELKKLVVAYQKACQVD